ncbi:hypothetical protein [Subtercola boreus]|uniref:Uncharacterized protein n=1 Tax=Subtercola boreus TaxID=120213 RepID=A0A3E0W9B8_9MICO|nr:hypothetical protein [Subtercola boreus]RFA18842.1 hypothetical protein B7R24_13985 [Subtercola boreus]RFA18956.1 hypothetical protein B7R23_13975 [Subtercola boreus]RFA25494.1 hypothetical protein B7R25_14085 [Subtercola boreus]
MKHVTYAQKSLLVGDEAADTLAPYSALLAKHHSGDTVTLSAYDADGDDVEATVVLDQGTNLMAESTHSSIPEPDNAEAVRVMREKMMALSSPPLAQPMAVQIPDALEELEV